MSRNSFLSCLNDLGPATLFRRAESTVPIVASCASRVNGSLS